MRRWRLNSGYCGNTDQRRTAAGTIPMLKQYIERDLGEFGFISSTEIVSSGLILNLDAGNVASYPGTGTVWTDLSGNSNTGILTNGPTYSSANGGSIVFDGTNDFVSLGRPASLAALFGTSAVSVDFWVKILANIGGQKLLFDSGLNECIQIDIVSNRLAFAIITAGVYTQSGRTSTLTQDDWYNFTGVYNGTNITTYLNSTQSSQVAKTGTISTDSGSFYIGQYPGGGAYNFPGGVAAVKIYNKALSAAEVTQNYNALKGRYGL
jgi:hypothetical protein